MKGTKLWVQAGSPLIHGRSRIERPFGQEAVTVVVVTVAALVVLIGLASWYFARSATSGDLVALAAAVVRPWVAYVVAVCVALAVLWFARMMGWRKAWVSAALTGALAGIAMYTAAFVGVL